MKKRPKEGDRCVGVITVGLKTGMLACLNSPSLSGPAFVAILDFPGQKFYDGQVIIFEYRRWRYCPRDLYCWQPALDYFETNRQEQ